MKLKPWARFALLMIILILIFTFCPNLYNKVKEITLEIGNNIQKTYDNIVSNTESNKKYEACMKKPYDKSELSDQLIQDIGSLDKYIKKNYKLSVKYEDISTGFKYVYNSKETYYAASTIKLLDALYIYNKAALNELDLDETLEYTSNDVNSNSKGMNKHNIGDEISLRELVKYAIIYSDNSAHQMLIRYIGFNTLKSYGNSLGATLTLTGGDNFGSINVSDASIYLKAIYQFIEKNETLGKELKEYLVEAEVNGIKYPDLNVDVAHKYGYYDYIYNDLGIVYDDNPYIIAILTYHGNDNYIEITNDISKKINDLHHEFYSNRESICKKN